MYEHDPGETSASATDDPLEQPRYTPDDRCDDGEASCEHALLFDGDGDYLLFEDSGALAAIDRGPFTLELWFRGPPDDERDAPRLLTFLDRQRARGLELGFIAGDPGPDERGLSIETPETSLQIHTAAPLRDDRWHHLALRRDGDLLELFLDGAPLRSLELAATPLGDQPLSLGRGLDRPGESAFLGLIAELRLWSVAREDAEIMALHGARLTGDEPGLVGYWPLSIGGGQRVLDRVEDADGVLGGDARSSELDPSWLPLPAPFIDAAP